MKVAEGIKESKETTDSSGPNITEKFGDSQKYSQEHRQRR